MMFVRLIIIASVIFYTGVAAGQEPYIPEINKLLNDPEMQGASLGICIESLKNDSFIFELNPSRSMVPASVLKIATSAAALEILGADYTFKTQLLYTGEIDEKTRFLNGNLIIKGGGDPALGSEYFEGHYFYPHFLDRWLTDLILYGIRGINGDILIDESIYEEQSVPDTWIWEDMGNYYGAGASALSVYDNMFRITFRSEVEAGKPVEILKTDTWAAWLEFENHVVSSNLNSDHAYVFGDPWGGIRKIRGTIPKNRDKFQIKASLPEPGLSLGNQLLKKLHSKNIPVRGKVKKITPDKTPILISEIESPPLSDIIKVLNHESVNLFAEHLVKQIAYEKNGLGSTADGIKIIQEFWKEKGIHTDGMFLEDGSGLSHFNAISPGQLVEILKYMKKESINAEIFFNSLPVPGKGTLYYFEPEKFSGKNLHCKSGSMTRVRCFAGFLETGSGNELAFAIMVNNFSLSHSLLIRKIEDVLLLTLP